MSACEFSVLDKFDLGACAWSVAFGWIPDWVWPWLPYWPWAAVLIGGGIAWRLAGMPGLVAFAGLVGFILGRRSVEPTHEHVDGTDADPPVRKRAKSKERETVSDWFRRSTGQD